MEVMDGPPINMTGVLRMVEGTDTQEKATCLWKELERPQLQSQGALECAVYQKLKRGKEVHYSGILALAALISDC